MLLRAFIIAVALVAVLTALYIALDIYLRWGRRRQLENEHASGQAGGLSREDYVQRGLARYERSVPKKAIAAIFAAPVLVLLVLILLAGE